MQCCVDCFNDKNIIRFIKEKGAAGKCSYCGASDTNVINVAGLRHKFLPVIELYSPDENIKHEESIAGKINKRWNVSKLDDTKFHQLLLDMFPDDDKNGAINSLINNLCTVFYTDKYKQQLDTKNESSKTLWDRFSTNIKDVNRFLFDKKLLTEITETLEDACSAYGRYFNAGTVLYRGRSNQKNEIYEKNVDMDAPPKDLTKPGRANPRGIPYLYLASDEKIAMHELKVPNTTYICVAEFKLAKRLRILNLCDVDISSPFLSKIEQKLKVNDFIQMLSCKLSEPVKPWIDDIEYLPTQFLSEFIKTHFKGSGMFHGIKYKSHYSETGFNLVLFNHKNAKIVESSKKMYTVTHTKQTFTPS